MAPFKLTAKQRELTSAIAATDAMNILLYGGSRSGKTFWVVQAIVKRALRCESRHGLCRRNLQDARTKLGDTLKDVFKAMGLIETVHWIHKAKIDTYVIYLPDGGESEIKMLGMDTKDRQFEKVLGDEYSSLYFNEANDIAFDPVEYASSRLAQLNVLKKRFFFDCNPPTKSHWLYKMFFKYENPEDGTKLDPEDLFAMQVNPKDNEENIDPNYIEKVLKKMSKRKQKKFWFGEFGDEAFGKVFNDKDINKYRVDPKDFDHRVLDRIIIAVDPNVTSKPGRSDDCGIVVGGKIIGEDDIYILEDCTVPNAGPGIWPKELARIFRRWNANYVVAETNQGGELVVLTIHNYDRTIPVNMVHAKQGKFARAEPVAEMYAMGWIHHVGVFRELEDEMVEFDPDTSKRSPNRMDALVYVCMELNKGSELVFSDPQDEKKKRPLGNRHRERTVAEIINDESLWS